LPQHAACLLNYLTHLVKFIPYFFELRARVFWIKDLRSSDIFQGSEITYLNITLFVPVLNELQGLKYFLPKLPSGMFSQILIVDGDSSDGSAEWARSQGYEVVVQSKKGLRHAYMEAWPKIRGEYVMTYSPDGNCKISDMQLIIDKLQEGYDMVIASRYYQGAKSEDDSMITGFGNWLFTQAINVLHGSKYSDAMTIYRAYRTSLFNELDLDKDDSYSVERLYFTKIGIEPLLSVRAAKKKIKVCDIPSDEPKRLTGKRKLQIFRWGAAYMSQVIREVYHWR